MKVYLHRISDVEPSEWSWNVINHMYGIVWTARTQPYPHGEGAYGYTRRGAIRRLKRKLKPVPDPEIREI